MRRIMAVACVLLLWTSCAGGEERILMTFGGDCVLGTREAWKNMDNTFDTVIAEKGLDDPFGGISALFAMDDWTVVNLECALTDSPRGHQSGKQHTFRGTTAYARMLPLAAIEMVTLSNNHYIDYGAAGRKATKAALDEADVAYCGYGETAMVDIKGHKIGFAGCRETVWKLSKPTVYREIQSLRKAGCEAVIYFCHWGKEYSPTHNRTQIAMAKYAVRSGADLIIGTHPHVPQGIGDIGGVPVVWSLGNLVFGGTHELRSFDGLIVQAVLSFDETRYLGCALTVYPILTSGDRPRNDFRPMLAPDEDKVRILDLVATDSDTKEAETAQ